MTNTISIKFTLAILGIMVVSLVQAGGTGKHEHHDMHAGAHKHDKWVTPPVEYQGKKILNWIDREAVSRGQKLYRENCMSCHGENGKGTGPAAVSLSHAPADLTNHFHLTPGNGDAYLYWRISEGGLVEPFKSMNSAMPAFKTLLSENERWDVLRYVHHKFHKGFKNKAHDDMRHEH